jgi:hypothetical protein
MGGGEREGSQLISSWARPGNFLYFLRTFRKFPGNSVIVPSLYQKRFPPWAYANLPYRAWENCSGQCKELFQAQKRKITMTSKESRNFCYSVAKQIASRMKSTYPRMHYCINSHKYGNISFLEKHVCVFLHKKVFLRIKNVSIALSFIIVESQRT